MCLIRKYQFFQNEANLPWILHFFYQRELENEY